MAETDQFVRIGQVLKSNGTDGQVVIGLRGIDADEISADEPVFIFFDELPVPFFVDVVQERGYSKILAYLTDVSDISYAEELVGKAVYTRKDSGDSDCCLENFIGWEVENFGKVVSVEDIPGNPCLEVKTGRGNVLIPFHEDLIVSADADRRVFVMSLPDGL